MGSNTERKQSQKGDGQQGTVRRSNGTGTQKKFLVQLRQEQG